MQGLTGQCWRRFARSSTECSSYNLIPASDARSPLQQLLGLSSSSTGVTGESWLQELECSACPDGLGPKDSHEQMKRRLGKALGIPSLGVISNGVGFTTV